MMNDVDRKGCFSVYGVLPSVSKDSPSLFVDEYCTYLEVVEYLELLRDYADSPAYFLEVRYDVDGLL